MICKLSPEDKEDGDSVIVKSIISVNSTRNGTGGWERSSSDRESWGADSIAVVRWQKTLVGNVGLAPERLVEVVTNAGHAAVPFNLTLWCFYGNRAVVIDDSLGGVNEGEAL